MSTTCRPTCPAPQTKLKLFQTGDKVVDKPTGSVADQTGFAVRQRSGCRGICCPVESRRSARISRSRVPLSTWRQRPQRWKASPTIERSSKRTRHGLPPRGGCAHPAQANWNWAPARVTEWSRKPVRTGAVPQPYPRGGEPVPPGNVAARRSRLRDGRWTHACSRFVVTCYPKEHVFTKPMIAAAAVAGIVVTAAYMLAARPAWGLGPPHDGLPAVIVDPVLAGRRCQGALSVRVASGMNVPTAVTSAHRAGLFDCSPASSDATTFPPARRATPRPWPQPPCGRLGLIFLLCTRERR